MGGLRDQGLRHELVLDRGVPGGVCPVVLAEGRSLDRGVCLTTTIGDPPPPTCREYTAGRPLSAIKGHVTSYGRSRAAEARHQIGSMIRSTPQTASASRTTPPFDQGLIKAQASRTTSPFNQGRQKQVLRPHPCCTAWPGVGCWACAVTPHMMAMVAVVVWSMCACVFACVRV